MQKRTAKERDAILGFQRQEQKQKRVSFDSEKKENKLIAFVL